MEAIIKIVNVYTVQRVMIGLTLRRMRLVGMESWRNWGWPRQVRMVFQF
jgi:hypothetical protein